MKKALLLSLLSALFVCSIAQANVHFELTNKSAQTIWICGYADDDIFIGEYSSECNQRLLPGESFSKDIPNGVVELTISIVEPGQRNGNDRYRTYRTFASANNKDKILIWNITDNPRLPLFPAVEKHLKGLIKTKINNNITSKELMLSKYKNL